MDPKNTKAKLDQVVGRAIRDDSFRQKLADDPKKALKEEGLSDDELEAISGGRGGIANLNVINNLSNVFKPSAAQLQPSFLNNLTKVAWCTDKTCNERG
jgi:hypothetical protein